MTCIRCNHRNAQRFGTYGKRKIQRYRCASCKVTFCEPHSSVGTHYIAPEKVARVLSLMMEGTSLRAITRLMDIDLKTVLSLLETTGQRCRQVFDTYVRGMRSDFVQADEIHTTVGCHQRRLRPDAPAEWGDAYTWIAIDSTTKMILSYYVGRRDADSANAFMRDLSQRMNGRFQLTTDGFRPYVNAVESAFGSEIDFAQLIKLYSSHDITGPDWFGAASRVTGTIPSVRCGHPEPRYVSTSHIERTNLSLRCHLRRFVRRTNAHSRKLDNLKFAVHIFMAWFCLCRVHQTLRVTPAMEAGLTDHIWTMEELICHGSL
jgi:transposase-like protein/IS1 family transposase